MKIKINFIIILLSLLFVRPALEQLQMPSFDNSDVKPKVESLFADAPEMVAVAKCESGFRQYSNYQALRGGNGSYIGVFQISEILHAQRALSMGYDIYTTDGNLGYARYLYSRSGTNPWIGCLKNPAAASTPVPTIIPDLNTSSPLSINVPIATSTDPGLLASTTPVQTSPPITPVPAPILKPTIPLTSNLQMGMAGPQVLTMQQLLNQVGFTIAQSGPGSPGNETTQFGKLTRAAIMLFQCKNNITCEGNESTTGYGRLGPKTRMLLIQLSTKNTP